MAAQSPHRLGTQHRYLSAPGPSTTSSQPGLIRSKVIALVWASCAWPRGYGDERLEAACRRALVLEACSYKSIQPILKTKMDQQPLPDGEDVPRRAMPRHDNIRGSAYYARADRPAEEPAQRS